MHRSRLGPGREFELINRAVAAAREAASTPRNGLLAVGPGDDAAITEDGWAVGSDISVEGVHFRRSWLSDREIGFRACAAALSDLAAVGAIPQAVLLSTALPRRSVDWDGLAAGVAEAARRAGAVVAGGDLASSPGPLVLDVSVLGRTSRPLLRSGARPGDQLWVTGPLGAAAAAVEAWESGSEPEPRLRSAFARPPDRTREGTVLGQAYGARAAIDLSDGLLADAGHMATASGADLILHESRVPVATPVQALLDPRDALEKALSGGEDYELLFAAPPPRAEGAEPYGRRGSRESDEGQDGGRGAGGEAGCGPRYPKRVGWVRAGKGRVFLDRGDCVVRASELRAGYDHMRTARECSES